jgi:RND family efflux transporter MFP subunit
MQTTTVHTAVRATLTALVLGLSAACGDTPEPPRIDEAAAPAGRVLEVRDTTIAAMLEAAGIAEPIQRATLSTRLMGAVASVLVQEGQRVAAGQLLARIEAAELVARRAQAEAGIAEAEAVYQDALVQAQRFRALFADSAAARVQLEAAETGLARAEAGLRTARAAASAVEAVEAYAQVRAPFAGVVTKRFVDPGAFVAPGAPVVSVEDASRLRLSVTVAPGAATSLKSGARLDATIEGRPATATIEGVAAAEGALYTVNAIVDNRDRQHPSGGVATLRIPQGTRTTILVPDAALVREGDLTGVRIQTAGGAELRWVRLGDPVGERVEVLSGLKAGDRVLVPLDDEDAP